MSTIRKDAVDLETLLNRIDPVPGSEPLVPPTGQITVPNVVPPSTREARKIPIDNTAEIPITPEKIIDFDYDKENKACRKRAAKTIKLMVQHAIKEEYWKEQYVVDKMELDTETLADLYMQQVMDKAAKRTILEAIARGNIAPRMYEVLGQLSSQIRDTNKQILMTEAQIRKTYQDLVFEIIDKNGGPTEQPAALPQGNNNALLVSSSKDIISAMKDKHREEMKAKLRKAKENPDSSERYDELRDTEYEDVK